MLNVLDLKINYEKLPTFVGCKDVRFSWKLQSKKDFNFQKSYRICILNERGCSIADTGEVESDISLEVTIDGLQLEPEAIYTVKLSVSDIYGDKATASGVFYTEKTEWNAQWIKPGKFIESVAPYIRKKFSLAKPIKRAFLYVSGLGCSELYLNGKKISEDLLDPPYTNYDKEIFYRIYDVSESLQEDNAFTAHLGEGFYAQSHAWRWAGRVVKFGDVCLLAELVIKYADDSEERIVTDATWRYKYGPIVANNLYRGETYDARFEVEGFADFDGDEEGWGCCVIDNTPKGRLIPCNMPAIRLGNIVECKKVWATSGQRDGAWILDFGKNFAGIAEFHLPPAPAGAQYVFRFAESLNANGGMDYRSSGAFATLCIQQDIYVCKGTGKEEIFRSRFTYHGFRYVEIVGFFDSSEWGKEPDLSFAKAYEVHTNLDRIGAFSCNHEYLMKTEEISDNTFLSNYYGIPTDCPVRERCGWLGDAQVLCNYGLMKFDLISSYEKYMRDMRTQAEIYGVAQCVAPGRRAEGEAPSIWGAAQILIPYWMYIYAGDLNVVRNYWDLMEKWVQHELDKSVDYLIYDGYGDWCPPVGSRRMPVPHSSSMQFFEICDKMSFLAKELGFFEQSNYYLELAQKIKQSILAKFYDLKNHTFGHWGSNGVALALGIYPEGDYCLLLQETIDLIKKDKYEMQTGMFANKYMVEELCKSGYATDVFKFLFNPNYHSFKTMIDAGATSVWEAIQDNYTLDYKKSVASYNHPMHSSFMIFCYSAIAGLKALKPGFKEFEISPVLIEGISELEMKHISPYGKIELKYKLSKDKAYYNICVPVNTSCVFKPIRLNKEYLLQSGNYEIEDSLIE